MKHENPTVCKGSLFIIGCNARVKYIKYYEWGLSVLDLCSPATQYAGGRDDTYCHGYHLNNIGGI